MAKCGYCGTGILFGGVRAGDQRYCNQKCHQGAYVLSVSQHIPPDVLERNVEEVWRGNCSKCSGLGPIDVHKVYEVWSMLVMTRWTTKSQITCRSCATKRQLGGSLFSLVFGWWGFPWGLILTPVQIGRNIAGMTRGPDSSQPSEALRKAIKVNLGMQLIKKMQAKEAPKK